MNLCPLQVTMLQGENSLLNSYKSTMQNLEQDKKSLEQKVVKLEASLQESQTNANILRNIDTSGRYLPFRFYLKLQDTIKTTLFPFFVNLKNMNWEHYFVGDVRLEKLKSDKEAAEGQVSQSFVCYILQCKTFRRSGLLQILNNDWRF